MKKILLIYCICLCSFLTYTQTISPIPPNSGVSSYALQDYKSSLQENVPPSVAAFHEAKLMSINKFRGAIDINVPLYEINQGGVSIPIRLNYLSTGVKVNNLASFVGLNWSLEAGGSIVKQVKGFEDFVNEIEQEEVYYPSTPNLIGGVFSDVEPKKQLFNKIGWFIDKSREINTDKVVVKDKSPDYFIVNAPALNTVFTHKKNSSNQITNPFEINYTGNEIRTIIGENNLLTYQRQLPPPLNTTIDEKTKCIQAINIKNNQGILYTFDKLDIDHCTEIQTPSSETTARIKSSSHKVNISKGVKAYHLSSIKDLNGDEIRFEYETYQMTINNYSRAGVWDIDEGVPGLRKTIRKNVFYPQLNRLKKIFFKSGTVEFLYGFNRLDIEGGGKALSEIIIKDIHKKIVKKIHLDYTYFASNNNCNEYYCKRLQLKEVYEEDYFRNRKPSYKFFYDPTALPVLGALTTDYLGYSKGLKPSYEDDLNFNTPLQSPRLYIGIDGIVYLTDMSNYDYRYKFQGKDLAPVFTYAKAGSLIKIIRPTGAIQEFEYELNSFCSGLISKDIPAAGLRIKSQTLKDEKGDIALLEKYSYKNEKGNSSGVVNSMPVFVRFSKKLNKYLSPVTSAGMISNARTFFTSNNENQLTNPGHIVYPNVTVKNGLNNGITEYAYTSSKDQSIKQPILYGKLKSVKIKDTYENLLTKENLHYTYQVFDSIESFAKKFQVNPLENDPILSKGMENNCLYKKIYSHRNMLTKIITEYFSEEYTKQNRTTNLIYDPKYPIIKEKIDSVNTNMFSTKYFYSADIINRSSLNKSTLSEKAFQTISLLKNKRMLSTPIQTENYINDKLIVTKRFNYKDFGNSIYRTETISISKGDNDLDIFVEKEYDTAGNIIQVSKKNGSSVVYIYGYNRSLLVAKIENARLSDIPQSYINDIQVASNEDNDRTLDINNTRKGSEGQLRSKLYRLYNLNTLQKSLITVYTYDPLIGTTSITDNRKRITYYDYDAFNRLRFVKDHDGNILVKHCYNYKGENKKCDKNN